MNKKRGMDLLLDLVSLDLDPVTKQDCLLQVALIAYSLRDFDAALIYCQHLYSGSAENEQIMNLHKAILYRQKVAADKKKDDQKNAAMMFGSALLIGGTATLLGFLLAKKK